MSSSITNIVKEKYGAVAESKLSSDHAGVAAVAEAFGYSPEELSSIPADANMGLSCGNPIALASLRPGETVVDLGSGGGLDVFLAAGRVGPTGRVIGIDMTPEMIDRARRAAQRGPGGKSYENVEFHLSTIDRIPLPDSSVDVVISNCVINLAPDKFAVFREMFRVLKPGGRVAVSDIALRQPLPEALARDVTAYVGCIAGAIEISEYQQGLHAAGFDAVQVIDAHADLNVYTQVEGGSACCTSPKQEAVGTCCSPSVEATTGGSYSCCGGGSEKAQVHDHLAATLSRWNVNDYAASVKVLAVKPK
jgi:SAM-dependent methyltransferase